MAVPTSVVLIESKAIAILVASILALRVSSVPYQSALLLLHLRTIPTCFTLRVFLKTNCFVCFVRVPLVLYATGYCRRLSFCTSSGRCLCRYRRYLHHHFLKASCLLTPKARASARKRRVCTASASPLPRRMSRTSKRVRNSSSSSLNYA